MSTNTVHFTISNPAISFLLHDCVKSPHNQIGFLFGEIHKKVTDVTSDSQSNNECIEITVSVTATLPVEDIFFSKDGTLNTEILDTVLGEYKKDVVGWYSFTRNQDLSPSIYQLFLAHQLCHYFCHVPEHLFLYFRISTNVVFGQNFTYTNKFLCTTGPDTSTPVEIHIRQLGESTHAYNAHKPVTSHSGIFDSVLNTIEWKSEDMVTSFETLQDLLSTKLIEQIDQQHASIQCNQLNQQTPSESANHDGISEDICMEVSPGAPPDLMDAETMDFSPSSDPIHCTSGNRSVPCISTNTTKPRGVAVSHSNSSITLGRGRGAQSANTKPGKLSNHRTTSPAPARFRNNVRAQSPLRTASPLRSSVNTARNNGTAARNQTVAVHQNLSGGKGYPVRGQKETHASSPGGRRNSGSSTPNPGLTDKPIRILSRKTSEVFADMNHSQIASELMDNSQHISDSSPDGDSTLNSPELNYSQTSSGGNSLDKSHSTYSSQEY